MKRILVVLAATAALSGCYTTKIENAGVAPRGEVHRTMQHTFFWGLISPGSVNVAGYCGDAGIAEIKSQVGGIGLLGYWITGGIWIPMTVKVTCGK